MSKEKIDLPKLQPMAEAGAELFPGDKLHGLGENSRSLILDRLNDLALEVPSYPYSAVFLEGNTIHIAQSAGTKREEKAQISVEPINLDNLKNSQAYIRLLKELKMNPAYRYLNDPNSTGLNIELNYYTPIGDHPDTEAIATGIKGLIKHEFGEVNDVELKAPKYLGLALFDKDRRSSGSITPASCASCTAVIDTLNKEGYNINVKFYTPIKFPTDKNYKIPKFIKDNPRYLDTYYQFLESSLEKLNEKVQDESNLTELYLRHQIREIKNSNRLDDNNKKSQIQGIKKVMEELKGKPGNYSERQIAILAETDNFKEGELELFKDSIQEALKEIADLKEANKGKLQKQENAKLEIVNLNNELIKYKGIKSNLEESLKKEYKTTSEKINLNPLKQIEQTKIREEKIIREIESNKKKIEKEQEEIKSLNLSFSELTHLGRKGKNGEKIRRIEKQITANKESSIQLQQENEKLQKSLDNLKLSYTSSNEKLYLRANALLKDQTNGEISSLSALDNIIKQYNDAFEKAKEQYYKANYAGAEKTINDHHAQIKSITTNSQNASIGSANIGSQVKTTTTNSVEPSTQKKEESTKNVTEKTGIKALINDIEHQKIGRSDNIVIYIENTPEELKKIAHIRRQYNDDQKFLNPLEYTEKLLNNALLYEAALNAGIKVVNSEKIASTSFTVIKPDSYKSRNTEVEMQTAPLKSEDTSKNNDSKIPSIQPASSANISSQTTTTNNQPTGAKAKKKASITALTNDIKNNKFAKGTIILRPENDTKYNRDFQPLKEAIAAKQLELKSRDNPQNGIDPDSYQSHNAPVQEQTTAENEPKAPVNTGIREVIESFTNSISSYLGWKTPETNNQNLTRTEKENINNFVPQGELNEKGKYDLNARLTAVNDNKDLLERIDKTAAVTANVGIKAIDAKKSIEAEKVGTVKVRGENDHVTDHAENTKNLIKEIQEEKIDKNTVIAIERKQYGENQGMKDIIKIAMILEHNEKNPDNPLKLPKGLENTLIYQDALLYKAAKENGIPVISLEGGNLEHTKESPLYNENREQYMANVINEVRSKGYNVIASVGSSHKDNLEKALESNQKETTGFNNIPRKLQKEVLHMRESFETAATNNHSHVEKLNLQRSHQHKTTKTI